jgi:outer membrane protein OmpA-like peptidoglycan-associated protein
MNMSARVCPTPARLATVACAPAPAIAAGDRFAGRRYFTGMLTPLLLACIAALAAPAAEGVLEDLDRCPDDRETVNTYKDDDGCPDALPVCTSYRGPVIARVEFRSGSAVVSAAGRAHIARGAAILREFIDIRLELGGHAHAREGRTPEERLALSRRRAEAVRDLLVQRHRIDPARLTIRAAGDAEPVDTNKTAAGRAHNARVESHWLNECATDR